MYEIKLSLLFLALLILFHNSDGQIYVQKLERDMMLINLTIKNTTISDHLRFNEYMSQWTTGQWLLNYSGAMTLVTPLTLVAIFLYSRHHYSDILHNKQLLAGVFLLFNFTMVSGQMWNQIKAPAFYHNSKNSPVYINGGSHGQFILESYIVATLSISFFLYLICCLWNILTIFYVFLVYYSQ